MSITDKDKVQVDVGAQAVPADVFEACWEAAEAYVSERVEYPTDPDPDTGEVPAPPASLMRAVTLLTARYLARRNSPDGFIGLGELGPARVPLSDRDVDRLIAGWRRVVIA